MALYQCRALYRVIYYYYLEYNSTLLAAKSVVELDPYYTHACVQAQAKSEG